MSIRVNKKLKEIKWKPFVSAFFLLGLLLTFLFKPYFISAKRLSWSFFWDNRCSEAAAPGVMVLQFAAATFLIVLFLYLLRMQKIIHREKEELAAAITNLDVGFCREELAGEGRFVEVNDGFLKILGYGEEELFQLKPAQIHSDSGEYKKFRELLLAREALIKEVQFKKKDGQSLWIIVSAKVIKNERREPIYMEYLVMDISERKWMEEEMSSAYLRFDSVIQNTPNIAIQGYDLEGRVLEWNHASEVLYGYSKHEMVGKRSMDIILSEQERKIFINDFLNMKNTGMPSAPRERKIRHKNNKEITIYSSMFPILQASQVIEIYCMDVDISDRVETEKRLNETKDRLESLALKDALTEIYNFRYFRERLAAEFERAKRTLSPISVMMIDIDYFKSINDAHGHQFGDKVLKQVAKLLKTELRTNDVVARWGGEEFSIILPDTNRSDALNVANKILQYFRSRSFGDSGNVIKLKCSIGIVSYPEDPLFSGEEIIDAGEESIYKAKERGGDSIGIYGHEINEQTQQTHTEDDRKRYIDSVKQKLSFYAVRSERSILEAIYSLAKSIELRDRRTREHCERMVELAEKTAQGCDMNDQDIDNVRRAAMLHDIGKLGISDAVLLKPGKLTPEEYEEVKKHPVIGADIISVAGFLKEIVPIILSHHERYDGTGYPRGLKGDEIPLAARVIAVVDVYEAVTSDRPYHKAVSKDEAIKILKDGADTQFDGKIVKIFLRVLEKHD